MMNWQMPTDNTSLGSYETNMPHYETQIKDVCNRLMSEVADVLIERAKQYGDPRTNFANIAKAWSLILGITITPKQVVDMMKALKVVRHRHRSDHDSVIDDIGYTVCGLLIDD